MREGQLLVAELLLAGKSEEAPGVVVRESLAGVEAKGLIEGL